VHGRSERWSHWLEFAPTAAGGATALPGAAGSAGGAPSGGPATA
jgi:hypothetical protein